MRLDVDMSTEWRMCEHEWKEVERIEPINRTELECTKCKCPAERWDDTGEIDWPTT